MTALALILAQAAPVLTAIGPQALPTSGCAAYLWQFGPVPQLVAMAEPAALRLAVDGKAVTLKRIATRGEARLGLWSESDYTGDGLSARLEITVTPQPDLAAGARVPSGALSVSRDGSDAAVVPIAGLVGCAGASS